MQARERFIALFDILGFKDMVCHSDIDEIFYILNSLRENTFKDIGQINKVLESYPIDVGIYNFSDTFYLYTSEIDCKDQKVKNKTFEALRGACYFLLKNACDLYLPLRGAIAVGEMIISENIIIGKPIIDAYEKEKEQDWIGCLITEDCLERINNLDFYLNQKEILRYNVPLKSGEIKEKYALNWLSHEPFQDNLDKTLDHMASKAKNKWEIKRKYINTRIFIDFLKSEISPKMSI